MGVGFLGLFGFLFDERAFLKFGAPGGTRTPTSLQKADFESAASTSSATEAFFIRGPALFDFSNERSLQSRGARSYLDLGWGQQGIEEKT